MFNMSEFVKAVKIASLDAVEATKPVNIVTGKVIGVNPLRVKYAGKIVLQGDQLILTDNVIRSEITDGINTMILKDGLNVGDALLMLRAQGGQQFVIFDKNV